METRDRPLSRVRGGIRSDPDRKKQAKYWENPDREDLVRGLTESRFTKEEMNGITFYHVRREFYSAFSVEHEYTNGMDRVAIVWSRNF